MGGQVGVLDAVVPVRGIGPPDDGDDQGVGAVGPDSFGCICGRGRGSHFIVDQAAITKPHHPVTHGSEL